MSKSTYFSTSKVAVRSGLPNERRKRGTLELLLWVPTCCIVTFYQMCELFYLLWCKVCQEAWNTMRNLLGTHLGHSALYNLCQIIQVSTSHTDIALIRGAVFFIGKLLHSSLITTRSCLW